MAEANAEHRDKPVDTGNRRLPAGIRAGVAKLSSMYTKQQTEDNGKTPKGETFFRASAVVMTPEQHGGEKVAGMVTQVVIPLCDVPAKGQRKAASFSDNWYEFQNLFKMLGIAPPNETKQTDPTGQRTEAYYFAAMKALCDPQRPGGPVLVEFSTRGWTPPATPAQQKPEEMVFETWHGLASPEKVAAVNGQYDPGAGVTEGTTSRTAEFNEFDPPSPPTQTDSQRGAAPPPTNGPAPQYQPDDDADPADTVAALVEVATDDPDGVTEDGAAAAKQLEKMAWAAGWTPAQTKAADDWSQVGDMALNPPTADITPSPSQAVPVAVGSKYKFAKRTKDGAKLKNTKGEEFPPQDVEVVTVDPDNKTCTLKTTKDGKPVVDIRSKQPIVVKLEWLE